MAPAGIAQITTPFVSNSNSDMKTANKYFFFCVMACFFASAAVWAQQVSDNTSRDAFNESRLRINKTGMVVLGSWAVANIAWGSIASQNTDGATKAFHQMNAGWNLVNLAIAGAGYYSAAKGGMGLTLLETFEAQKSMENILLFNAGLDVGYVMGGLYLQSLALKYPNRADQLRGFGRSLVLQGAFLLLFDVSMATVHNRHFKKWAGSTSMATWVTPQGQPVSGLRVAVEF